MKNIKESIRKRRSVRTFDGRVLDDAIKGKLSKFMRNIKNPFDIPVEFKFLDEKEYGLSCPVAAGTNLFIAGKIKNVPNASVAFGFSFETLILYAESLSLGTVWLGGTMNRSVFEEAMELEPDEIMPCATPVGYTAKKKSMKENVMRKAIKADERLPFEELFFNKAFDKPLAQKDAGEFAELLEMVRLAPSAVNKQPWRVVVEDNMAHFYLKRSKGFGHDDKLDMQMIDMGIALSHFALTAEENGINIELIKENPNKEADFEAEYIASYRTI